MNGVRVEEFAESGFTYVRSFIFSLNLIFNNNQKVGIEEYSASDGKLSGVLGIREEKSG